MIKYTEEQRKIIGENIWIRRNLLGMSTRELGEAYGCTPNMVNVWERGESVPPRDRIRELAKILKCSMHELHRAYNIPKLSFTETRSVVEKKEEPVMSDEEMVQAAAKVFGVPDTKPTVDVVEEVVEEPKPIEQPKDKGSISDRMNQIYDTLFSALDEMDKLKADIAKIEKVTAMLKEIQGL